MEAELHELEASIAKLAPVENTSLNLWIDNPYIKAATADNTRKAYRSDVEHFEKWGGRLPASAEAVAGYLQAYASKLNPRTLARRLTALKHWHCYQGYPDPTQHPAISKTMSGIMRVHGKPQERAYPLAPEDLLTMVRRLQADGSLTALRDNALLQVGFFGAFRRSELVQIRVEHLDWKEEGIDVLIPGSKTDQAHQGQYCALPYGRDLLCPVTAIKEWLESAGINEGPIFRGLKRNERLGSRALTPISVNNILRKCAKDAEISYAEQLSSHSLRRGLATSASMAGVNLSAIMRQGRWKQVSTVIEYIEASERFSDNVSFRIIEKLNL